MLEIGLSLYIYLGINQNAVNIIIYRLRYFSPSVLGRRSRERSCGF